MVNLLWVIKFRNNRQLYTEFDIAVISLIYWFDRLICLSSIDPIDCLIGVVYVMCFGFFQVMLERNLVGFVIVRGDS